MRVVFFLIAFLFPLQAFALSTAWSGDDAVQARLISGVEATGDSGTIPLGLEMTLSDGWHTYWRSPGEAGLPPQLEFKQDDAHNIQSFDLLYPAPKRYTAFGLETVGYREHVVFPINVTPREKGKAVTAEVSADILVCSSICVPKHYDLSLEIPAGEAKPSNENSLLEQAKDHLPQSAGRAGLLLVGMSNDGQTLTFNITARDTLSAPDIFVEDDKNVGFGAPIVKIDANTHTASLSVKPVDTMPEGVTLAKLPVTLTIVDGDRATEIKTVTPAISSGAPVYVPEQPAFLLAITFALIGGFILNLMPCVLPVLSLKILNLVGHGGGHKKQVRQSFLMTACGILFSFFVLACVMVALRHFGLALGWGVQFQQPVFLMFLVLLLTFFATNLWGIFEIPLPPFLADIFDEHHPKLAGDFATGAFATLLATPCSAPFLGTAVGFALASGTAQIFAIFMTLGLGMGIPYFVFAVFPRFATLLPKPGAWMLHLKRLLGLALALTALWLVWVLAAQITVAYAVCFGLFMTAVAILLILRKRGYKNRLITLGIIEFCAVALILGFNGAMKPKGLPQMDKKWLAFSQTALDADIAEGKTVFLDVTADWCLTCKANMKFALSDDEVARRLFTTDIIAMQADWTNPDPAVVDLLHKYGRYGIPFNIVYGPNAPQGIPLPELLTPGLVIDALNKASAKP